MFAQSLPHTKKREFLKIVRLLQTFEAPLLWDGKTEEEIMESTDLSDISLKLSDSLKELWKNAARIYGDDKDLSEKDSTGIIEQLLNQIRGLRITHQNEKEERLKIATTLLSEIIKDQGRLRTQSGIGLSFVLERISGHTPSEPEKTSAFESTHSRIIIFEAMRLSGTLTESKRNLLQVASVAYGIDGASFNELLAQALALHKEMKRSVNLVLE